MGHKHAKELHLFVGVVDARAREMQLNSRLGPGPDLVGRGDSLAKVCVCVGGFGACRATTDLDLRL